MRILCRDARDRPSCSAELLKKHYSVLDKTAVLALADMVKLIIMAWLAKYCFIILTSNLMTFLSCFIRVFVLSF